MFKFRGLFRGLKRPDGGLFCYSVTHHVTQRNAVTLGVTIVLENTVQDHPEECEPSK
jgi:hypothetical protein